MRIRLSNFRIFVNRRTFVSSSSLRAIAVESVPALGESITDGTLAKWLKNVGDSVTVDEVVAVIETDKVTVDIKSKLIGKIIEQLAKPTATVTVGAPLYKIETSGDITSTDSNRTVSKAEQVSEVLSPKSIPKGDRIPLIKFLGKRSLLRASKSEITLSVPKTEKPSVITASKSNTKGLSTAVDFWTLKGGAWFGRPVLSAEEIEAIESGGAPPTPQKIIKTKK